MAEWYRAFLAHTRPWVQCLVLKNNCLKCKQNAATSCPTDPQTKQSQSEIEFIPSQQTQQNEYH